MNPKLRDLLERAHARYEVIPHREVYTAQERAAACHLAGARIAKVVVVRDDDWYAMAVVPATASLDVHRLAAIAGRPQLAIAAEREFAEQFSDCEVGAMPPFGRLYRMAVYVDRSLANGREMVFESGSHREEVRMPLAEYLAIEAPVVVDLTTPLAA